MSYVYKTTVFDGNQELQSERDVDLAMSVPSLYCIPAFAQARSNSASKLEQMEGGREILGTG